MLCYSIVAAAALLESANGRHGTAADLAEALADTAEGTLMRD